MSAQARQLPTRLLGSLIHNQRRRVDVTQTFVDFFWERLHQWGVRSVVVPYEEDLPRRGRAEQRQQGSDPGGRRSSARP
jgi:hypothetical protein